MYKHIPHIDIFKCKYIANYLTLGHKIFHEIIIYTQNEHTHTHPKLIFSNLIISHII